VAVFQYSGVPNNRAEDHSERGYIVARDKIEAFDKLKRHGLSDVQLRRVEGLASFLRQFTANIK